MVEWTVHASKRQAVGDGENGVFRIETQGSGTLQVAYLSNKLKRWSVIATAATMIEAQRIAERLVEVESY
jgi:acetamidase/formamidase